MAKLEPSLGPFDDGDAEDTAGPHRSDACTRRTIEPALFIVLTGETVVRAESRLGREEAAGEGRGEELDEARALRRTRFIAPFIIARTLKIK